MSSLATVATDGERPLTTTGADGDVSVPVLAANIAYRGADIPGDHDLAVQWIHANARDAGA